MAAINETFGLGYDLDPVQERIVRSSAQQIIVNCTRQWGKTSTIAAKVAHEAMSETGLILVLAPVERQAKELFRKITTSIKHSLKATHGSIGFLEDNKTTLELTNGSRIVALPAIGENIRGYTNPRMIVIDEAAFVKDEDYRSIRPMLSHGARLIVMSTPFGKRGWFHETWNITGNAWERYCVLAEDCHHIPKAFLDGERVNLGPWWYSQEYECKFLDNISSFFDMDAIRSSLEDGVAPLWAAVDTINEAELVDSEPLWEAS